MMLKIQFEDALSPLHVCSAIFNMCNQICVNNKLLTYFYTVQK